MTQSLPDIPKLDRKGLREFGLATGAIVAGLFGLALPKLFHLNYPLWPWIVGGVLIAWALLLPSSLKPIYSHWMRFGLLLSRITTPLILGLVFFIIIAPVGFIMRLVKHDPMARRLDEDTQSFRVKSRKAPKQNMEKPF